MTTRSRDVVAYMLQRLGCTHPFRLSRLLALAEMEALERLGRRLTDLRYVPGPGTFYIEGFKESLDEECFHKREGDPQRGVRGCLEYTCEPPSISEEERSIIDSVIERYSKLSDEELNRMVVEDPRFRKLTGG